MKGKLLALFICITIAAVSLMIPVHASETEGGYTYEVSNGEATITMAYAGGDTIIPSTLGGYPVTKIADFAFSYNDSLTSVIIPDGVTSIGGSAFSNCISLTSITIPDSVSRIGGGAFNECTSLAEVYISDLKAWCEISFGSADANPLYYAKKMYLNNNLVTDITIPANTTCISNYAFYKYSNLTNVTFPNSVTNIGSYAFYGCNLSDISIPDSVTRLGVHSFSGCNNLQFNVFKNIKYLGNEQNPYRILISGIDYEDTTAYEIHPKTVIISDNAFNGFSNMTSISIPNSVTDIGSDAFTNCNSLYKIFITDLKAWCEINFVSSTSNPLNNMMYPDLFLNGNLLTGKIEIPEGTVKIGNYAFTSYQHITDITIPNSVTSIGDYAFQLCTNLKEITIPNSVSHISEGMLAYCSNLNKVSIPDSITSIGTHAFFRCGLKELYIPSSVISIGTEVFTYSSLTSVTIGNGTVSISDSMFYKCTSLTDVTIPDGVTSIGSDAFYGCTSLTDISIPDSITSIGTHAFFRCGLKELYIPSSVISIGTEVFTHSSLTSVTIGNGAVSISDSMFYECTSLTDVTIPDGVTSIGSDAFYGCTSLTDISIPDSVTSIGTHAFFRCGLKELYIPSSVISIGTEVFTYSSLTSVTIGNGTVSISDSMFYKCTSLTDVTIPDGVTSIGSNAFYGCTSLTDISIPDSVTSIGPRAFYDCSSLTDIIIPNRVTSIEEYTFYGCTSLTDVTIPDGVTSIGSDAFYDCSSLTDIIIPDSITNIDSNSFYDCSNLTAVYITDIEAWLKIRFSASLGESANPLAWAGNLYLNNELVTELKIPNSITSINACSFHGCNSLTKLIIPESVTDIGAEAFRGCRNLNTIVFEGDAPSSIGGSGVYSPFLGVTATAYFPEDNTTWTEHVMYDLGEALTWKPFCAKHNYEEIITPPTTTAQGYTTHTCTVCGYSYVDSYTDPVKPATPSMNLRFASAYLSLESDLSVIFQVKSEVLAEYDDVTLTFKVGENGQEQVFSEGESFIGQNSRPSFKVTGVAPRQVTETIYATLHGYYDGVEYSYTMEYSASNYCYSTLRKSTTAAKLKTLIVDLLNYAAAHQVYGSTNLDNMANANLTDAEKALGTASVPTMVSYQNVKYVTHAAPTARFKNASLYLESAVTIRCLLNLNTGIDINKVTVKITDDAGNTWTVPGSDLQDEGDNNYYLNFNGLSAQQMRNVIYLTICENGKAISHTLRYSIETYAASKYASAATNLKNLILTMIRYGDSAKAYFESK